MKLKQSMQKKNSYIEYLGKSKSSKTKDMKILKTS